MVKKNVKINPVDAEIYSVDLKKKFQKVKYIARSASLQFLLLHYACVLSVSRLVVVIIGTTVLTLV